MEERLPSLTAGLSGGRAWRASSWRRAVEVGPRRQGGLLLVPEIDARAAVERLEDLEIEVEVEEIGSVLLIEARVYAVAPREKLDAYTRTARRLGEERRQQDPRPRRR